MKPLIARTNAEHKLYALQSEWAIANDTARKAIAASIQDNPQWEIEIGSAGPQFKNLQNAPESPTSNLQRLVEHHEQN